MRQLLFSVLVLIVVAGICNAEPDKSKLNDRPIIAVIAQKHPRNGTKSYIAASYVKYLEAAGARVVPIPHTFSPKKIAQLFKYVNGVFLPGGGVDLFTSAYYKSAEQFWNLAVTANDKGDYFPIWGTCMGFEVIHVIRQGEDVLSERESSDKALPLVYTPAAKTSKLFKDAPKDLFEIMGKEKVTWNHHHMGISPQTFRKHSRLRDFFNVLSLNVDEKGYQFISTVEAYKYPFYGVQWHPEKNNFEFTTHYNELPHTFNGVRTSQYMASFFVNEARKNFHKFPNKEMEDKYLIYNYKPSHSALSSELTMFEQVYYFY